MAPCACSGATTWQVTSGLVGDEVTLVAGHPSERGWEDGPGPEARFEAQYLGRLASDGSGSIFYIDGELPRRIQLPPAWHAAPAAAAGVGGIDPAPAAVAGAPLAVGAAEGHNANAAAVANVTTIHDEALWQTELRTVTWVPALAPRPQQQQQQQQQPPPADAAAGAPAAGAPAAPAAALAAPAPAPAAGGGANQQPAAGGTEGCLVYGSRTALHRLPLPLPLPNVAVHVHSAEMAGREEIAGVEDGQGNDAEFFDIVGIAADAAGYIYVLDKQSEEGRLRRVSPDGTTTTRVTGLPRPPTAAALAILPNGCLALCDSSTSLTILDLALQPLLPRLPQAPQAAATAVAVAAAEGLPPPRSLPADLGALLDAQPDGTADLVIRVGERRFHAHRLILSSRCDYFKQRLVEDGFADGRAAELDVPDADPDAFALLLRWLYTGGADIPLEQARGMAELADRLLLPELCDVALEAVGAAVDAATIVDSLLWAVACSESRDGAHSGFGALLARLKGWYVSHHEEVAAEAGDSRKRLAESAPGLSIEITDALIAKEREEAAKRAKRPRR
ncbi:hypothetical protein HYH02_003052 [Chlamydomonas schloesseri]|uniref:BTB domain-containing protein n=1 Tax=Chlamydomonas schloesseri TaxID=2026947 RepID=A0A835WSZ0_9CHLO|nr:hypothetical protein HYH02_003052 [Chlamydomonas schloesseri]|eukprot:KAG2452010.1 hypothetical protein HYH02_003052 [Chlamydomonas schloesseri]